MGFLAYLQHKGKEKLNMFSKGQLILKCFIAHLKEQAFNLRNLRTGLVLLSFKS